MLDEWSNPELTQPLVERVLVVALVRSEGAQIARVPAGDLLAEVGVASFQRHRAVQIEDRLALRIDAIVHIPTRGPNDTETLSVSQNRCSTR